MMHKALSSIEEVSYCLARSSVKFQGHTALKIIEFDQDWAFPDCNLSLNSPMGTKWCTKLEVAWKRCPIVLQGHPSNFTVTPAEKLTIWIQFEITRPVAAIKSLRFALLHFAQVVVVQLSCSVQSFKTIRQLRLVKQVFVRVKFKIRLGLIS